MPPRVRISKEDIIAAAVEVVRKDGVAALNARSVAAMLNCSTQPVFTNFATMEELRFSVIQAADKLSQAYINKEIERGEFPPYKASGMAYIRFAKEEKELFRLLYMRDRSTEVIHPKTDLGDQMEALIQDNAGVCPENTSLFHMEMWAYVHGIAAMVATGYLELEWDLVSQMLTDAYQGLIRRFRDKEE